MSALERLKQAGITSASAEKATTLSLTTELKAALIDPVTQKREWIAAEQARIAADKERNENSWVSDRELNTFIGGAKNMAASAWGDLNRTVGEMSSSPSNLAAQAALGFVSDESRAIWSKPEALRTAEDNAALDYRDPNSNSQTQREFLTTYENQSKIARDINTAFEESDAAKAMNPLNASIMDQDLKKSYEENEHYFDAAKKADAEGDTLGYLGGYAKGISSLILDGGIDIINNPQAAFEYAAAQAPQIALGAATKGVSLGVTNAAYGVSVMGKNMDTFIEENGRQPTKAEQAEIAGWSVLMAAAEQVGEMSILKAIKPSSSKIGAALNKVIPESAKVANQTAKNAIKGVTNKLPAGVVRAGSIVAPVVNTGGRLAKTSLTEAGTEMFQTSVEEELGSLGSFKDIEGFDLYKAGVAGAAAAGGIASGGETGRAIGETVKAINNISSQKEDLQEDVDLEQIRATALETGDVNSLFDRENMESPNYRPDLAVDVLENIINNPDSTDAQRREAESDKKQIIDLLNQDLNNAKIFTEAEADPRIPILEQKIEQAQDALAQTMIQENPDQEAQEQITNAIDQFQGQIDALNKQWPETKKAASAQLDKTNKDLKKIVDVSLFNKEANRADSQDSINKNVDAATNTEATAEERTGGVQKVLAAMAKDPDLISDEQIAKILKSDAPLTTDQRDYFTAFTEANAKINSAQKSAGVAQNILEGRNGFKGLKEYANDVAKAVQEGNTGNVQTELGELDNFEANHTSKKTALDAAIKRAAEIKGPVSIYKDKEGNYVSEDGTGPWTNDIERSQKAGFTVKGSDPLSQNSAKKVQRLVAQELDAIKSTKEQLNARIKLGKIEPDTTPIVESTTEANQSSQPDLEANESDGPPSREDGDPGPGGSVEKSQAEKQSTTTDKTTTKTDSKTPEFDKLPEHQEGQKTFTYAGIGSRGTPEATLAQMTAVAKKLEELGYTLQSGGAKGADSAFESGTDTKEIFTTKDATDTTRKIAKEMHPNPSALKEYPLNLMARNTNQVFGANLDTPVDFVLYWAEPSNNPDRPKGGTGQAVEMANRKGIPTINMMDDNWLEQLEAITTADTTTETKSEDEGYLEDDIEKLELQEKAIGLNEDQKPILLDLYDNLIKVYELADASGRLTPEEKAELQVYKEKFVALDQEISGQKKTTTANTATKTKAEDKPVVDPKEPTTTADSTTEAQPEVGEAEIQEDSVPPVDEAEFVGNEENQDDGPYIFDDFSPNEQEGPPNSEEGENANYDDYDNIPDEYRGLNELLNDEDIEDKVDRTGKPLAELDSPVLIEGLGDEALKNTDSIPATDTKGSNAIRRVTDYIQRYFTVKAEKENNSVLPLARVANFLSEIFTEDGLVNINLLTEVATVPGKRPPRVYGSQLAVMQTFKSVTDQWRDRILFNFLDADPEGKNLEYRYRELDKFFIQNDENGNRTVDENVISAIQVAAFTYVAEAFGGDGWNSRGEINKILGRREDHDVSYTEEQLLSDGWNRRSAIARNLGVSIMAQLGIKAYPGTAPEVRAKLEVALGTHALDILIKQGALEQTQMNVGGVHSDVFTNTEDKENSKQKNTSTQTMIRVVRDPETREPTYVNAAEIRDRHAASLGFINDVFGTNAGNTFPVEEPGTHNQTKLNGSRRDPTKLGQDSALESSNRPYEIRQNKRSFLETISLAARERMFGVKEPEFVHPGLEKSLLATNNGKRRTIEETDAYMNGRDLQDKSDDPIYLHSVMWPNQRNGFLNNIMNPQTNKWARQLMGQKVWSTSFNAKDASDPKLELFLLGAGFGIGIKTDKQLHSASISQINELLDPTSGSLLRQTLDMLVEMDGKKLSEDQEALMEEMVEEGDEDAHTVEALYQLKNYLIALKGDGNFETDITLEVDGVTNGQALLQINMGNALGPLGNKFGFYSKNSEFKSYPAWYGASAANLDLYQEAMINIASQFSKKGERVRGRIPQNGLAGENTEGQFIQKMLQMFPKALIDADGTVTSKGRNFTKTMTTAIGYGSTTNSQARSLGNATLEDLYQDNQDIANNTKLTVKKRVEAINKNIAKMNTLIQLEMSKPELIRGEWVQTPLEKGRSSRTDATTIQQALNNSFLDISQEKAFKDRFYQSMKGPIKVGLERTFGTYLEDRQVLSRATQGIWKRYNTAYQIAYKNEMDKAIANGEIAMTGGKNPQPLEGLDSKALARIEKLIKPMGLTVHTAMSKAELNLAAGFDVDKMMFLAAKEEQVRLQQIVNISPNDQTPFTVYGSNNVKDSKTYTSSGQTLQSTDPGVRVIALLTQAMDSAIMVQAVKDNPSLSAHDAGIQGIEQTIPMAKSLNKATLDNLVNYSISEEITVGLFKSMKNAQELAKKKDREGNLLLPGLEAQLAEITVGYDTDPVLVDDNFLDDLTTLSLDSNIRKLQNMLEVGFVNQYGIEGGEYKLTAEDYVNIENLLQANIKKKERRAAKALKDQEAARADQQKKREAKKAEQETKGNQGTKGKLRIGKEVGPLGLGKPEIPTDDLFTLLNLVGSEGVTFGELLPELQKSQIVSPEFLKGYGNFQYSVMDMLGKVVPADTKVVMLGANDPLPETIQTYLDKNPGELDNAAAFYNPLNNTIYFKSPEFVSNDFGNYVFIHESMHAFTHDVIAKYEDMTSSQVGLRRNPKHKDHMTEEDIKRWEAVQDLKKLKELVEKSDYYKNLPSSFKEGRDNYGMTNLDEFVAEGYSNPAFMYMLSQVQIKESNAKKFSALSLFRDAFAKLFYGKDPIPETINAMDVLMSRVTSLAESQVPVFATADHKTDPDPNGQQIPLLAPATNNSRDPKDFSSQQIFEQLGLSGRAPNAEIQARLSGLLRSIVNVAYEGSSALRQTLLDAAPQNTDEAYIDALYTDNRPFVSGLIDPLRITDQEAMVLESLDLTVREALNNSPAIQQEVSKFFEEVKEKLSEQDLPPGVYDLIFNPDNNIDKSTYLSMFMAASLAYDPLFKKMQKMNSDVDDRRVYDVFMEDSFAAAAELLLQRLLEVLTSLATGSQRGGNYANSLESMARKLATIERKQQTNLIRQMHKTGELAENIIDSVDNQTTKMAEGVKDAIHKRATVIAKNRDNKGIVAAVATIVRTATWKDRTDGKGPATGLVQFFSDIRDNNNEETHGFVLNTVNEMLTETDANSAAYQMTIEQNKKDRQVKLSSQALTEVVNDLWATPLTEEESESITEGVRADLGSLLTDGFTIDNIMNLLKGNDLKKEQDNKLQLAKAELASMVKAGELNPTEAAKILNYYENQSKYLAWNLVSGYSRSANQSMNAWNIAALAGDTGMLGKVSQARAEKLFSILNPLTSLYAVEYMDNGHKTNIIKVITSENNRTDKDTAGNGVTNVFKIQQAFEAETLKTEFKGNRLHMQKGYTRENYNPFISVVMADEKTGKELLEAGYTEASPNAQMQTDPTDKSLNKKMYVLRGAGLTESISGFIPTKSQKAKGTTATSLIDDNAFDDPKFYSGKVIKQMSRDRRGAVDLLFTSQPNLDPRKETVNYMAPVLNERGRVSDYRYLANNFTKNNSLERENRVEKVLGSMAGDTVQKTTSKILAKEGIEALKAMADAEYALHPERFIEVSAKSSDKAVRERFFMLSETTKKDIKDTFGGDRMLVRKDIYTMAFGYPKFSIADMFNKQPEERTGFEKWFVNFMENAKIWPGGPSMGKKAAVYLLRSERGWQSVVKLVKDIRVIRNLVTLIGNELSNISMLWLHGVGPVDIIAGRTKAAFHTNQFRKDESRKLKLEAKIDNNLYQTADQTKKAEQQIKILNDRLEQNPVSKLMDAGMYQTLVEDIDTDEEQYAFQNSIDKWVEEKTAKVPKGIKTVAKNIAMTHDTVGYKVLNRATIMSDFTSRAVLYEKLKNRKKNPMSEVEAIRIARGAFVNYDVATNVQLQYINDMGILPFTKYYLRIQSALMNGVASNPGRSVALMLLGPLADVPTILNSSMLQDPLPGSLSAGAFEIFGAVKELATVRWL